MTNLKREFYFKLRNIKIKANRIGLEVNPKC